MENYTEAFRVLGDISRLRIMNVFVRARQAICVCELVDALGLPQYQVSRQVQQLKQAGLLKVKKQGTWAYYYLNEENSFFRHLFDFLESVAANDEPVLTGRDMRALNMRLSLRENGRCVVGKFPHKQILEVIED